MIQSCKKIQLYANYDKAEYAIRLKGETSYSSSNKLLAATNYNNTIEYAYLLDESDYFEDLEYNWKYTLEHWIKSIGYNNSNDNANNNESNNKLSTTIATSKKNLVKYISDNKKKIITYNQKVPLKCHFCKLAYFTNKERIEHEHEWHANKKINKFI